MRISMFGANELTYMTFATNFWHQDLSQFFLGEEIYF